MYMYTIYIYNYIYIYMYISLSLYRYMDLYRSSMSVLSFFSQGDARAKLHHSVLAGERPEDSQRTNPPMATGRTAPLRPPTVPNWCRVLTEFGQDMASAMYRA